MVLQKAETINSLTPTFKKYEEATGAKLNFNKCFVLSTESFKLVSPWAEMARSNYCSDETVYLGVRLSKWLSLLKDWEKVILKMKKVGAAIKKRGGNFHSRVRMVNTYLTPCMGYCYNPVGSWFCPFGAILISITAALSALSLPLSSFSFLFVFLLLFSPVLFLLFLLFVMLISALFCCSYL